MFRRGGAVKKRRTGALPGLVQVLLVSQREKISRTEIERTGPDMATDIARAVCERGEDGREAEIVRDRGRARGYRYHEREYREQRGRGGDPPCSYKKRTNRYLEGGKPGEVQTAIVMVKLVRILDQSVLC